MEVEEKGQELGRCLNKAGVREGEEAERKRADPGLLPGGG